MLLFNAHLKRIEIKARTGCSVHMLIALLHAPFTPLKWENRNRGISHSACRVSNSWSVSMIIHRLYFNYSNNWFALNIQYSTVSWVIILNLYYFILFERRRVEAIAYRVQQIVAQFVIRPSRVSSQCVILLRDLFEYKETLCDIWEDE